MKRSNVYEFKDLSKETQKRVREEFIGSEVEDAISILEVRLNNDGITEKEFYDKLGCSKSYAESTGWFVPACYYDKNKEMIKGIVADTLSKALFTAGGQFIQYME